MYLIYPIALSIHYLIDVAALKLLSDSYDYKKIMINVFFIAFLALFFIFPKEVIVKPNFNYIYILIFSANILFGLYIWYKAIKAKTNLGELEGIAIAIYLPLLTLGSALVFKQKLKTVNMIGIFTLAIGAYLTLK